MNKKRQETSLSQLDSFFVAYQEHSGILMQQGAEAEIEGSFSRKEVEEMLEYVVARWPQLGQRLSKRAFGLAWRGTPGTEGMFRMDDDLSALDRWRNEPIEPFHQPPFQVLWVPGHDRQFLSYRGHHAATDGESFLFVAKEALRALAAIRGGKTLRSGPTLSMSLDDAIAKRGPVHPYRRKFWEHVLWLRQEARSGNAPRLWKRECVPGEIAQCERVFEGNLLARLHEIAAEKGTSAMWLSAASWIKAIHAWNAVQGDGDRSFISLEIPVSLRRGGNEAASLGNLVSPLVLRADGSRPVEEIARSLKQQLISGVRHHLHLAVPYLTRRAAKLPWGIFKRLAVSSTATGFATSHFTWLPQEKEFLEDMERLSNGALRIVRQRFYVPVCLHMGAALSVLSIPERVKFCITYRKTALTSTDANTLADLLVDSVFQAHVPREELMA